MNKYEEKINTIKETEKYLLEMAKSEIEKQNKILNLNIQDLICMLNYNDSTVKKYEATLKAQMLIEELTNEIISAKDIDEIKALRNKLNYYINKIKSEVKERNIPQEEIDKYYENATNLRKNIAKYVRYVKREDNIKEIERLNNKEDLNEDEKTSLKKLIRLESDYGRRNKNPKKVEVKPTKKDSIDMDKLIKNFNNRVAETKNEKNTIKFDFKEEIKNRPAMVSYKEFNNIDEYLKYKLINYDSRYELQRLNPYDGGIVHNIGAFIKNIPAITYNKEMLKLMNRDAYCYDRSPEFASYISYNKKKNSLKLSLMEVLY